MATAACLLVLAVLFTAEGAHQVAVNSSQRDVLWWEALLYATFRWYIWLALFPIVFLLACRFPLEGLRPGQAALVHAAAGLALVLVVLAAQAQVRIWAGWAPSEATFFRSFRFLWNNRLHWALLGYVLILCLSQALRYYFSDQDRRFRESRLEADLARTKLEALRAQIHPHFLFNTLNHCAELIHADPHRAEEMILQLSELLRSTLDSSTALHVPLRLEIDFINRYLRIQQLRFGGRLKIRLEIDPSTLDHPVPNLLLQPLVENAIKHGIAAKPGAGTVRIASKKLPGGELELTVRDDGTGFPANRPTARNGAGIGLANVQARLEKHYGNAHRFELRSEPGQGVEVYLVVPGGAA